MADGRVKSRRFTVQGPSDKLPPRLDVAPLLPPNSGIVRLGALPRHAVSSSSPPVVSRPTRSYSAVQSRRGSILDSAPPQAAAASRLVPPPARLSPRGDAAPAEHLQWDAHVFRLKRREAQMAIENLPKYAALVRAELLRNASKAAADEADAKLKAQVVAMDDELFAEAVRLITHRTRARAFEVWRAFAHSMKKLREPARQKMTKAPSFSARLELLASQNGPRQLETRGSFRKFKDLAARESALGIGTPPREASSTPADATSTPVAPRSPDFATGQLDFDIGPVELVAASSSMTSLTSAASDSVRQTASSNGLSGLQQLYAAAVAEEDKQARRPRSVVGRFLSKFL